VCARTVIPLAEAVSGGMGAPADRHTFVTDARLPFLPSSQNSNLSPLGPSSAPSSSSSG
jgi:hypothetical protein